MAVANRQLLRRNSYQLLGTTQVTDNVKARRNDAGFEAPTTSIRYHLWGAFAIVKTGYVYTYVYTDKYWYLMI